MDSHIKARTHAIHATESPQLYVAAVRDDDFENH